MTENTSAHKHGLGHAAPAPGQKDATARSAATEDLAARNGSDHSVELTRRKAAAAANSPLVTEYGASIVEVAENIRRNVIRAVEHGTGLEVVEVNISVADVHLPEDDEQPREPGQTLA